MTHREQLHQLAALYGIETSYLDVYGKRHHASEPILIRLLEKIGAHVYSQSDVSDALKYRKLELCRQNCEPVCVIKDHTHPRIPLLVHNSVANSSFQALISDEQGDSVVLGGSLSEQPTIRVHDAGGDRFIEKVLSFEHELPKGYHTLHVELNGGCCESLLLSPPQQAWQHKGRSWGLFAPLYALHSRLGLGANFANLEALMDWAKSLGAATIGTLPLLPTFLNELFDPSPYAPVSRLFWNEFYLDVEALAVTSQCEKALAILKSQNWNTENSAFRKDGIVDYRRQMALRRCVLEELVQDLFQSDGPERREFDDFVKGHNRVQDYAEFRAATEKAQTSWQNWPDRARYGRLRDGDYRSSAVDYHLYAQWRCSQQLVAMGDKAKSMGIGLYLDLPLGVHPAGYDIWRERNTFLEGCSLGAPPDLVFTGGQDWGLTPLHPVNSRGQGYRYFVDCLRHHMSCAGILRIDHVMGLHRVYCVPHGASATEGVYIRYCPEELYAIVALESTRAKTLMVGEDLGTVPDSVRESMKEAGVRRMHVLQYELEDARRDPFENVTKDFVASVNTHDFPPFASWWNGSDIGVRVTQGLLPSSDENKARARRTSICNQLAERVRKSATSEVSDENAIDVLVDTLMEYASSPADLMIVNLEDLWGETQPQNEPGTGLERPNWRRKFRHSLEDIMTMPTIIAVLERIDNERRFA